MNNKGFEFSFGWIFSIIVGIAVLALAIFAVTSLINQERYILDTESAQQLEALLNPLQTGGESLSRPGKITFPIESQIITRCDSRGKYGENTISVGGKVSVGSQNQEQGFESRIEAHYIFSEKVMQGKEFSVLVRPFYFPYKVGDTIILWTGKYCLINPFQGIRDNLEGLNASGIRIVDDVRMCGADEKKVCFGTDSGVGSSFCNIEVNGDDEKGSVKKNSRRVYYESGLVYAAIFSDVDNYECNVKRLALRAKSLADTYSRKAQLVSAQSGDACGSSLVGLMDNYALNLEINGSRELSTARILAKQIEEVQEPLLCSLWRSGE
ncbi:MAG: hypothetical protein AABW80_04460 [Nanoarchaeota archaeon]